MTSLGFFRISCNLMTNFCIFIFVVYPYSVFRNLIAIRIITLVSHIHYLLDGIVGLLEEGVRLLDAKDMLLDEVEYLLAKGLTLLV